MAESVNFAQRLEVLRRLLGQNELSTQDELRAALLRQRVRVTQSTVSRDLRRIGAIKMLDAGGRTVYKLPAVSSAHASPPISQSLRDMIVALSHNGHMIVIRTSPGSASLLARHLDEIGSPEILGTLAGDDTVFVAPAHVERIDELCQHIERSL